MVIVVLGGLLFHGTSCFHNELDIPRFVLRMRLRATIRWPEQSPMTLNGDCRMRLRVTMEWPEQSPIVLSDE